MRKHWKEIQNAFKTSSKTTTHTAYGKYLPIITTNPEINFIRDSSHLSDVSHP